MTSASGRPAGSGDRARRPSVGRAQNQAGRTPRNRLSTRSRRVLALFVVVTAWGLAAASVALAWIFQLPAAPVAGTFLSPAPPEAQARFDDIGVAVAIVYAPLAAVLLLRRPQPVAVLLAVHAVGSGLAAFGVEYGLLAQQHPSLPAAGLLAYAGGWGFVPGTFATAIVPVLLLPRTPRALRAVLIAVVAAATAAATVAALTHDGSELHNPLAPPWPAYQAVLDDLYAAAATAALVASLASAAVVAVRIARTGATERPPLVWLLAGHVFLTASYIITVLPASLQLAAPIWAFGTIAPVVGQLFYPSAILVMGLQHRLRGVDVAVSAVLTTSIVAVLAVGGYLLAVTTLELAGAADGVAVLATAAAIALALLPLRRLIRRRVDHLVYGEPGAPERLLSRLGADVGEIATGTDGMRALAAALRRTLRLGRVRIDMVGVGGADAVAPRSRKDRAHTAGASAIVVEDRASDGRLGPAARFPLDVRGEAVLTVAGPVPELPVGRRMRDAIEDLAPVIGAVARLAAASTALDEARARAAAAQHAERRALRRELHDGLGPALSGAGFSVAAAMNLLARGERTAAVEAIARVEQLLDEQAVTLAGLARGGSEPVPDLSAALVRLVDSFAGAGPEVRFVDRGGERIDPQRAGIVHRIASEAVLNAVRHSGARTITVTLGGAHGEVGERVRIDETAAAHEVGGTQARAARRVDDTGMHEETGGEVGVDETAAHGRTGAQVRRDDDGAHGTEHPHGQGFEILRVRDDGRGLPSPDARTVAARGVGLSSMREWAEEAGLECLLLQPESGGTIVLVRSAPAAPLSRPAGAR